MVRFAALVVAALTATVASAATACGSGTQCPESAPCCSQYGECGTGAYCLGGCDPVNSFALDACTPAPICQSKTFSTWDNTSDIISNEKYLGNASEYDWVASGTPITSGGDLILTMANGTVGTLVAYNHYIWYGTVSGTFKTSRDAGVVTAFILLSDAKDEIDYEFIGANLTTAQTNYYFQGILDYDNEVNATIDSDSFENFHTYEIDWTPDSVIWYLDGKSVRVLNRNETYNATSHQYKFPQTPARLELSLWPGGLASNAAGTIAWAGGEINWDSQDIQDPGYYYAIFSEISITCYDPPSGANVQGSNAYIYTNSAVTNNTVEIVNNSTVLNNFEDTGLNMTAGASTSTASASSASSTVSDSIPGEDGGTGARGGSNSTTSSSSDSSSSDSSSTSSAAESTATGFSQGTGSSSKSGTASVTENMAKSSIFAVLVAVVALVAL